MNNSTSFFSKVFVFFLLSYGIKAQEILTDSLKSDTMSIEQLSKLSLTGEQSQMEKQINQNTDVASKKALSIRRSPSIVSIITEEEIKKTGARDIIDVLRMIPGFDFGSDVAGSIGLGIRGNWSHEGKCLVLLDGQEMNETLYGTTPMGNNYPIHQIKRVEVIRGPGSSVYGGYAAYGVVNIITKSGEDINGVSAHATTGFTSKDLSRLLTSVAIGQKYKGFDYSLNGLVGMGTRSDQVYTDLYGGSAPLTQSANKLNPSYLNFSGSYKGLSLRLIYDKLDASTRDGFVNILSRPYSITFSSYLAELKYDLKIGKKLTLTPKINFKSQKPWNVPLNESSDEFVSLDIVSNRSRAGLTASYDATTKLNFILGGEVFNDRATSQSGLFRTLKSNQAEFTNFAGFAQVLYKYKYFTPTLGVRYDKNTAFDGKFSPRFGIVSRIWKLNLKALYSQSFRAPTIANIALAFDTLANGTANIKPESSSIFEFEIGLPVSRSSYFTINLFDITTQNVILYYLDNNFTEFYRNGDVNGNKNFGSRGAELEFKTKEKWGFINASYSFYTNLGKPQVDDYRIDGINLAVNNVNLGLAQHLANLYVGINITKNITISPSLNFIGSRYATSSIDENDGRFIQKYSPVFLTNLILTFSDAFKTEGLNFNLGVYDLLNQKYMFLQPYTSTHGALPALSREFVFKVSYQLSYKK